MKNTVSEPQHTQTLRRRIEIVGTLAFLAVLVGSLLVVVNVIHHGSKPASTSHTYITGAIHIAHAVATGLYVGGEGELYKLDTQTGKLLWSFPTQAKTIPAPATVAGSTVYFGDSNGSVYALQADTGKQLWSFSTGGPIVASPTVDGNQVYVGSTDSRLYALNAQTGAKVWSYDAGRGSETVTLTSATVVDDVVYASATNETDRSYVFAVDAQNGAQVWRSQASGVLFSAPQVYRNKVYVVSSPLSKQSGPTATTSRVEIFNAKDGSQPTQPAAQPVAPATSAAPLAPASPVLDDGIIYFGSQDCTVSALKSNSTSVLWHLNFPGQVDASLVLTDKLLYVGVTTGTINNNAIIALNPADGSQRWQTQLDHYAGSNMVVSGNALFVGTDTAQIYALDANSGSILWTYQEPVPFGNTPLAAA
jgi:eukaryotic-like serine/threonine-protein kinase